MSEVQYHQIETDLPVCLSENAMRHVVAYLDKQDNSKGLRLSVKKTGCSGLSYVVDYVVEPKENDIVQVLTEKYQVYIDKASYPFLKGMVIDYIKQGLNSKFVFTNPNQTGQCGCGESFTVE